MRHQAKCESTGVTRRINRKWIILYFLLVIADFEFYLFMIRSFDLLIYHTSSMKANLTQWSCRKLQLTERKTKRKQMVFNVRIENKIYEFKILSSRSWTFRLQLDTLEWDWAPPKSQLFFDFHINRAVFYEYLINLQQRTKNSNIFSPRNSKNENNEPSNHWAYKNILNMKVY